MPSFLSKVFGRKKDESKAEAHPVNRPSSDASLLEGKFEAVPQVTSPTAPRFEVPPDVQNEKEKEKEGFGLFKSKSIRTPPDHSVAHGKQLDYHLSLNLPGPKEESTRALGVVFEADPDAQILLPESVIAERRLSPLEAFLLVQTCSQAINARGPSYLRYPLLHMISYLFSRIGDPRNHDTALVFRISFGSKETHLALYSIVGLKEPDYHPLSHRFLRRLRFRVRDQHYAFPA
jgi:hypothetical protein